MQSLLLEYHFSFVLQVCKRKCTEVQRCTPCKQPRCAFTGPEGGLENGPGVGEASSNSETSTCHAPLCSIPSSSSASSSSSSSPAEGRCGLGHHGDVPHSSKSSPCCNHHHDDNQPKGPDAADHLSINHLPSSILLKVRCHTWTVYMELNLCWLASCFHVWTCHILLSEHSINLYVFKKPNYLLPGKILECLVSYYYWYKYVSNQVIFPAFPLLCISPSPINILITSQLVKVMASLYKSSRFLMNSISQIKVKTEKTLCWSCRSVQQTHSCWSIVSYLKTC